MTDTTGPKTAPVTPAPRQATSAEGYTPGRSAEVSGWTGWVVFAGVMLIMLGAFQAIEGLVALFDRGYYLVGANGLVVSVDYTAWGWTHLIIGILAVVIGIGLIKGNTAALVMGVVLAGVSAIVNLAFIAAYPLWSTIVIAIDVIIIYAILVHGRELHDAA
ncbi:MAG TPA: hypothetical protein VGH99_11120 [Pseudonocardia sp.]|jgi:hypothetical protein